MLINMVTLNIKCYPNALFQDVWARYLYSYTYKSGHTCGALAVHRVADDLVCVVLWFLPGEQGRCAGVGHSREVARWAWQTFPHNDRQLGSCAGCAKPVVCYALVVALVLQGQLVDEQDPRALGLHSSERLNGMTVLKPVQHRRRFP